MIDYKIGENINNNNSEIFTENKKSTSEYEKALNNNIFQTSLYRLNRDEYERTNQKINQTKKTNFWLAIIAICCTINTAILLFICKIICDIITNLNGILNY